MDCILPWLTERSPTCPLCKAVFETHRETDFDYNEDENSVSTQNTLDTSRERDSIDFETDISEPIETQENMNTISGQRNNSWFPLRFWHSLIAVVGRDREEETGSLSDPLLSDEENN